MGVRTRVGRLLAGLLVLGVLLGGYLAWAPGPWSGPRAGTASPGSALGAGVTVTAGGADAGYTAVQLTARASTGFEDPALFPAHLPAGQSPEESFLVAGYPITSAGKGSRAWMTDYSVDTLPPATGNSTGYTVFQTSRSTRPRSCGGHTEQPVRRVGDNWITVCLGPHPSETARQYWGSVPFTDDVEAVTWVTGEEE